MEKDYKNLYEELIQRMLKNYSDAIKFIENPSEEMKLAAVKDNPFAIQFVANPTEEMKLIAVKGNPWAIRHIEDPNEEVQLEAVKKILLHEIFDAERIRALIKILEKIEENKGAKNGKRL